MDRHLGFRPRGVAARARRSCFFDSLVSIASAAVVAASIGPVGRADAGVTYLGGTAFYTHTPVNGSGAGVFSNSDAGIPSSSNLNNVGFTMNRTVALGAEPGSRTRAVGRIGFIANATTSSIALKQSNRRHRRSVDAAFRADPDAVRCVPSQRLGRGDDF